MAAESLVEKLDGGLRVLVADEDKPALDGVAAILRALGHEVVARATSPDGAAAAISEDDPQVAMVKLHSDDEHAKPPVELLDKRIRPQVSDPRRCYPRCYRAGRAPRSRDSVRDIRERASGAG